MNRLLPAIAFAGALFALHSDGLLAQQSGAQQSTSPSLWDQIKTGVNNGVQKGLHGNSRQAGNAQSLNIGSYQSYQGPIFLPLQPAAGGQFSGLFSHQNHAQAQQGKFQWPRAAITFVKYGGSLPCWNVRAKIWSSANASHDEQFQICDGPITTTDDLGHQSGYTPMALSGLSLRLKQVSPVSVPNTGHKRTEGPTPPVDLWGVDIAEPRTYDHGATHNLQVRLKNILQRIAWVSGYLNEDDLWEGESGSNLMLVHFSDARMWFAGFDPNGNVDNQVADGQAQ